MSGLMRLPYTYVNATILVGGLNMPPGTADLIIVDQGGLRILLTGNADEHLRAVDKCVAVANIRLDVTFGGGNLEGSLDDRITRQLERIRADRATRIANGQVVLMFAGTGEEDVNIGDSLQEYPDFLTVANGTPRGLFSRRYREELDSIKAAVSLEIGSLDHFEPLADRVYFQWADGRPLYTHSFSLSGKGTVAQGATEGHAASINRRFAAMRTAATPRKAQRLIARMADEHSDRLRQFIFGWMALEIFVNNSFAKYDPKIVESMVNDGASRIGTRLVKHGQDISKNGYRIVGRFVIVASILFPTASDDDQEADVATFRNAHKLRNDLLHGDDISEESLPIGDLKRLHRKFIGIHLTP